LRRALALAAVLAATQARSGALPPRYGGEIRVLLPEIPADLDPARASSPAELVTARALHATLLEVGPSGRLRPVLLAALPEAEPGGRAFRMRLRPGLRFHDGQPLLAADVAASLARLLQPSVRSPHAWLALAVQGAEAVREGRAASLAGVQVLSDLELRVALDAPLDLPRALAAAPAAIVSRSGAGAGPFRPGGRTGGTLRLPVFDGHASGRAYADSLALAGLDARRAARAFSRGEADLALRPEAVPGAGFSELPALTASYALVNPRRTGSSTAALRRHLAELDRAELTRLFVRGPAVPLLGPLPPAILAPAAQAPGRPAGASGGAPRHRLSLLVSSGAESHRAVADRIQVKLFDRGVRVVVQALEPGAFAARLAAGDWDLALVAVTFVAPSPSLAVLQLAQALGGIPLVRRALARLDSADPAAVAAEVAEAAQAVPLFASGLRASIRPGLEGFAARPDGTLDPGALWRREGPSR